MNVNGSLTIFMVNSEILVGSKCLIHQELVLPTDPVLQVAEPQKAVTMLAAV